MDEYRAAFPASEALADRAAAVIAGRAAHESWRLSPFPVHMRRAEGAWKWSVDDRKLVDLWMGHGSLLLGHGFAPVVEAVRDQAARGTHLGGEHELEVRWAEAICALVPSAQRVRFTSSGTEATMLAVRIARAVTGRPLVVRLDGHFHGWHDGALAHLFDERTAGIGLGAAADVVLVSSNGIESAAQALEAGDVAAVMLEPGGGSGGVVPCDPRLVEELRAVTRSAGALLVFDEVVTGFRAAPGGVQQQLGVTPDLTCLGKIMAGGLPGAAVAGRSDVMDSLGPGGGFRGRVTHTGTFNANPLSAAAGLATLEAVAGGEPQRDARERAATFVELVNDAATDEGVDVRLFLDGTSIVHTLVGGVRAGIESGPSSEAVGLAARNGALHAALRRALLVEGVDAHPLHAWMSSAHGPDVLEAAAAAYMRAFRRLRTWPEIAL